MALRMEPGQIYNSWLEFKQAFDDHCAESKVVFNVGHAKTVEQANSLLKKAPYFSKRLKYASITLKCKHFGSYKSLSLGMRPKQRSYKINCKSFISVSACRKEGYLIIRDAYHIHSHICNEEIYNSYPEVRRMSKDEKEMVGTLMDMGVPISQIKTAIGRNVTPKDIQNARTHVKRIKLGLENDDTTQVTRRRRTYQEIHEAEGVSSRTLSDAEDTGNEREMLDDSLISPKKVRLEEENIHALGDHIECESSMTHDSKIDDSDDFSHGVMTMSGPVKNEKSNDAEDSAGLSELLAAAGVNSDSVVLTVNQALKTECDVDGTAMTEVSVPKNSYTVTISLPDGDVTHTGTDLQELLKGLPLDKIGASNNANKTLKTCEKCETYVSPLDGHSLCLQCLGHEHLNEENCIHCKAMKPEHLKIRRKQLVGQRMKALKELTKKRICRNSTQSDSDEESISPVFRPRKSQRNRKPKNYGPDFVFKVDTSSGRGIRTPIASSSVKMEPFDDCEATNFEQDYDDFDNLTVQKAMPTTNSARFDHLLRQSVALGDVCIEEASDGSLYYTPDQHTEKEFMKKMKCDSIPAVPLPTLGQYTLNQTFESQFCSDPQPLSRGADIHVQTIGKGLVKLVKNAAAQTRLAIYDKLFTRLGEGMADEALAILSQLYGKVSQVTEISQEDLTNDLQTALDTIQALKDVLQELGIMSNNAVCTAAHQRSLTVQSLNIARRTQRPSLHPAPFNKGRFKPFSSTKLPTPEKMSQPISTPKPRPEMPSVSLPPEFIKHLVVVSTAEKNPLPSDMAMSPSLVNPVQVQDRPEALTETSQTFLNVAGKEYSVAPISATNDLIQTLRTGASKDNVIELHVVKDDETGLLTTGNAAIEEVIQSQPSGEMVGSEHTYYQLTE